LFWSGDGTDSYFTQFADTADRLLDIYESSQSEQIMSLLQMYMIPEGTSLYIDMDYTAQYAELLNNAENALGETDSLDTLRLCMLNSADNIAVFDDIFDKMSEEHPERIKSFMVSGELLDLRAKLQTGGDERMELDSRVSFSRDGIKCTLGNSKWNYHFINFRENPYTEGVITMELDPDVFLKYLRGGLESGQGASDESGESSSDILDPDESGESSSDIQNSDKTAGSVYGTAETSASNTEDFATTAESSEDAAGASESLESDSAADSSTQDEDVSVHMYWEPSVTAGTYYPHTMYTFTFKRENGEESYDMVKTITYEDGREDTVTTSDWGGKDEEVTRDSSKYSSDGSAFGDSKDNGIEDSGNGFFGDSYGSDETVYGADDNAGNGGEQEAVTGTTVGH
jgi:hypothetical protein